MFNYFTLAFIGPLIFPCKSNDSQKSSKIKIIKEVDLAGFFIVSFPGQTQRYSFD